MRKLLRGAACAALIASAASACAHASAAVQPVYGLGRPADPRQIAAEDLDVAPDGAGLPSGHGDAVDGSIVYAAACERCHGASIRLDPQRWPYATTLFDFIRRAMPPNAPQRLSAADVYALSAYELYMNGLLHQRELLDAQTLPQVPMPGRNIIVGPP